MINDLTLLQGFGIKPHEVVRNFLADDHAYFVEDQDLSPMVYAEQFVDINSAREQTPEELLSQARMILSTELGKDPLLRQDIRELSKEHSHVSVVPTEKGISKIDSQHPYFVCFSSHYS